MNIFFIGLVILLLSGFVAGRFNQQFKTIVLSIITAIGSACCLIPAVKVLVSGQNLAQTFEFNNLFGAVSFVIDPLAAFFIGVVCVMSLISVIYSNGYLKPYNQAKMDSSCPF